MCSNLRCRPLGGKTLSPKWRINSHCTEVSQCRQPPGAWNMALKTISNGPHSLSPAYPAGLWIRVIPETGFGKIP